MLNATCEIKPGVTCKVSTANKSTCVYRSIKLIFREVQDLKNRTCVDIVTKLKFGNTNVN